MSGITEISTAHQGLGTCCDALNTNFKEHYLDDRNLCPECGNIWQHGIIGCGAKHLAYSGLQVLRPIPFLWIDSVEEIKKQWQSPAGAVGLLRAFAVSLYWLGMIPAGYVLYLGALGLFLGLFLVALFIIAAAIVWAMTGVSVVNEGWWWN